MGSITRKVIIIIIPCIFIVLISGMIIPIVLFYGRGEVNSTNTEIGIEMRIVLVQCT